MGCNIRVCLENPGLVNRSYDRIPRGRCGEGKAYVRLGSCYEHPSISKRKMKTSTSKVLGTRFTVRDSSRPAPPTLRLAL